MTILLAIALMLLIEGLLPLVAPALWREAFRRLTQMSDGQIRFIGLLSTLCGVLGIALVSLVSFITPASPAP
ncbi:MAG: DUF2065 domain-containing protein [Zoogloeaceae bacterium]|jgi:uncharacterized protein YjeT (DUF2065 family)|nr:DUF2065 domain-containing protein [Zoogloeaceae bacterium]